MSNFTLLRPFFRTELLALNFKEWKDAFNVTNIPSTILNNSFHIESVQGARRDEYNALDQPFNFDVTIRVFKKGYRTPADSIDECMTACEAITARILASDKRIGAGIKNIFLESINITPIAASNDNAAVLEITFTCFIIICV
jgi:hypothetical protein